MMLNVKLNDTAQKILWEEDIHMCKRVRNSMATTGSTKSTFEYFYEKKPEDHWFIVGVWTYRLRH